MSVKELTLGVGATQSACAAFVGVFCVVGRAQQCAASFPPPARCCCTPGRKSVVPLQLPGFDLNLCVRLLSAVQVPALQQLNMYGCRRASGPQLQVVLDRLPALQWISLNGCHGITTLHLTRRSHSESGTAGSMCLPWVWCSFVLSCSQGSGNGCGAPANSTKSCCQTCGCDAEGRQSPLLLLLPCA
jgi:hypothetical protein